jgi:hypothetical protein
MVWPWIPGKRPWGILARFLQTASKPRTSDSITIFLAPLGEAPQERRLRQSIVDRPAPASNAVLALSRTSHCAGVELFPMPGNRGIGRSTNLATFSETNSGAKLSLTVGAAHSAIQSMYPHYVGSSSLEPSRRHLTSLRHWRARRTPAFSIHAVNCFKILHLCTRHRALHNSNHSLLYRTVHIWSASTGKTNLQSGRNGNCMTGGVLY